ncbi:MAG: aspartate--tRNA(Asn) ligase [Candidatus Micrarchaeia archaeon]|jgi:aspartyl-tRNA synthetase
MERTLIKELQENIGKEVLLKCWIVNIRDKKKIKFLVMRDRTGETQGIALEEECDSNSFELISNIYRESVVEIEGNVKKSEQAKQGYEVSIKKIKLLSASEPKLPTEVYGKIESNLDTRLDNRFLDTRRPEINAIFKIRSQIFKSTVEFLDSQGFTKIATPKITILGLESPGEESTGSELFTLDYFGKKAYLAQSPQLYKQMFVAGGFERVYEIGPVFRAEKSHTTRHLTEFTGIDFEMGFIENEHDIMDIIEGLMIHITTKINEKCKKELEILEKEVQIPKKIPRLDFHEIREILKQKGKEIPIDEDLDAEGEKVLSEYIKEKYNEEFVFALNYPFKKRPFYHMKPENDSKGTRSFDLIYNGVEIATGSQREHRLEILSEQAKEKGLDLEKMSEYKKIFQYGCPPHGGVGMGLDRITEKLLKLENIREAILLPRDPERLKP